MYDALSEGKWNHNRHGTGAGVTRCMQPPPVYSTTPFMTLSHPMLLFSCHFFAECPAFPTCDENGAACECQPGADGYSCGALIEKVNMRVLIEVPSVPIAFPKVGFRISIICSGVHRDLRIHGVVVFSEGRSAGPVWFRTPKLHIYLHERMRGVKLDDV